MLAALVLTLHHRSSGQVGYPYGALCLIDVLTAGAGESGTYQLQISGFISKSTSSISGRTPR
jgi:hypothetical protein